MKKNIVILSLFAGFCTCSFSQNTTTVLINGKSAGKAFYKGEGNSPMISLKRLKVSATRQIIVNITGNFMNADMYKKDLQLLPADSMENNNGITIEESVSKKGNFNITQYALKKLIAGKKLQLTLSLNPVNRRMMIPSRMIPVCIISMK